MAGGTVRAKNKRDVLMHDRMMIDRRRRLARAVRDDPRHPRPGAGPSGGSPVDVRISIPLAN